MNKDIWNQVYKRENLPWTENPIPKELLNEFCNLLPNNKLLDYGGGDGLLSKYLINRNLDITLCDISSDILKLVKDNFININTIECNNPNYFVEKKLDFGGVLCWGVLHHVPLINWVDYMKSFYNIISPGGYILIGGHSIKDTEFKGGKRISPTTKITSNSIDELDKMIKGKSDLTLVETGYFPFIEAFTQSNRVFKYFIFKREI